MILHEDQNERMNGEPSGREFPQSFYKTSAAWKPSIKHHTAASASPQDNQTQVQVQCFYNKSSIQLES